MNNMILNRNRHLNLHTIARNAHRTCNDRQFGRPGRRRRQQLRFGSGQPVAGFTTANLSATRQFVVLNPPAGGPLFLPIRNEIYSTFYKILNIHKTQHELFTVVSKTSISRAVSPPIWTVGHCSSVSLFCACVFVEWAFLIALGQIYTHTLSRQCERTSGTDEIECAHSHICVRMCHRDIQDTFTQHNHPQALNALQKYAENYTHTFLNQFCCHPLELFSVSLLIIVDLISQVRNLQLFPDTVDARLSQ